MKKNKQLELSPEINYSTKILAKERANAHLTLKELSNATGIQATRLFRLENTAEMVISELRALSAFYNVDLLALTTPPTPRFALERNSIGWFIVDLHQFDATNRPLRVSHIFFLEYEANKHALHLEQNPNEVKIFHNKGGR